MAKTVEIQGFEQVQMVMKHLPKKYSRKILLSTARKSVRPFIKSARNKIRGYNPDVAASMRTVNVKDPFPTVMIGPMMRVRGKWKTHYIARWIEFGTSGVGRFSKNQKSGSSMKTGQKRLTGSDSIATKKEIFKYINARRQGRVKYRSDQPAKPFFRPAWYETKPIILRDYNNELRIIADKVMKKYLR